MRVENENESFYEKIESRDREWDESLTWESQFRDRDESLAEVYGDTWVAGLWRAENPSNSIQTLYMFKSWHLLSNDSRNLEGAISVVFFVVLDLQQVKYLLTILCSEAALLAIYEGNGKITGQSGRSQAIK